MNTPLIEAANHLAHRARLWINQTAGKKAVIGPALARDDVIRALTLFDEEQSRELSSEVGSEVEAPAQDVMPGPGEALLLMGREEVRYLEDLLAVANRVSREGEATEDDIGLIRRVLNDLGHFKFSHQVVAVGDNTEEGK